MRVTHKMIVQSVTRNLRENLAALEKKSMQLSSGRYFDRPSQDPVGTYKVMRITGTGLFRNEQYRRNIGEGITWLTVTEVSLADATEAVQRLRELAIYSANGTLSPEDRLQVAPEVNELLQHLVSIGNTEVNGLYIFGGHQTQQAPYVQDGGVIDYQGDNGQRVIEITPQQTLTINLTGLQAFDGAGLFAAVSEMYHAMQNNDSELLGGEILQKLDHYLDLLLRYRAEIGARVEGLYATEERMLNEHLHLTELRSKIEDIDLAKEITAFRMQENVYHAALATSASMIFPSLIDFLR